MTDDDWPPSEVETPNGQRFTVTDVRPPREGELYVRCIEHAVSVREASRDYPDQAPRLIVEWPGRGGSG